MSNWDPRKEVLGALKQEGLPGKSLLSESLTHQHLREALGPVFGPAASSAVSDLCKPELSPPGLSDPTDSPQEAAFLLFSELASTCPGILGIPWLRTRKGEQPTPSDPQVMRRVIAMPFDRALMVTKNFHKQLFM